MTREEIIQGLYRGDSRAIKEAIKTLEQEPCEDEIMLTKEEYGQLLSNEFDNGYAKGYREALEQEHCEEHEDDCLWEESEV